MTDPQAQLAAYNSYLAEHPELFDNPPEAAFEIVSDPDLQKAAGAGLMYRDDYVKLLRDAVRFPDGSIGPYVRLVPASLRGGAAVLPLLDGRIVLLRHFRHATRKWHWEIPRGFSGDGELPEETARREIIEELKAPDPRLFDLGSMYPDTGASTVLTRLYLAILSSIGDFEVAEGIKSVRLVTPDEFDSMARDDQITDSFTLASFLRARLNGHLP